MLLTVAFCRWDIERNFEDAKGNVGLDHFQVRQYRAILRHLAISDVSLLFLAKQTAKLRGEGSVVEIPPSQAGDGCDCPAGTHRGAEGAVRAIRDGIVETIHYSSVCLILNEFDLKPHRTRYWLHSQDPNFEKKAATVLWYYERAESFARDGVVVLCLDEKTGIQALGRKFPDRDPEPGQPRLREFEYVRHGVVNLTMALDVATGGIWGRTIGKNDQQNMIDSLERLDHAYRDAKRIELILDNGSSHVGRETQAWFEDHAHRVRPHFTPTHASWLNQAELALGAFSRRYPLDRVVEDRQELANRISRGMAEYNILYRRPFNWTFNRRKMHDWWARHKMSQNFVN